MKAIPPTLTAFVILPEVTLAMTHIVLVRVWVTWTLCTFRFPTIEEDGPVRLVTTGQLAVATVVNLVLFTLLGLAALRARRSAPGLRRGHYAGIIFAVGILVILQVLAIKGHTPIVPHSG
ncbi:hypothetical protein [Engelhardtia mirabilis]|uniref:Uncharacterized protein n=1 Tax=Engelhardtia mirabilis TaxID=2528011 RepID=A0A518BDS7_9BACT|nr:hypothetical protein Pla133_01800 [Planctomycetes bacterium Pla133]QDU99442.1 hypothetical protein Pla86_01800 [Planctomycetes bacterium Pla86]